jgi:endonuclease/exonuclease/phosphatase (EEP) superfamily protein YafD
MEALLAVVGGVLVAATLLPMLRHQSWWIRVFDFPRMQIAAALLLALAAHLALVEPSPAAGALRAAMAACLVVQAWRMFPYTRLHRAEVQESALRQPRDGIRLMFANVLQDNRNAEALLAIVREADPDVVLALETDAWWCGALAPLAASHPHKVLQPQPNTYGMALYSRLELVRPRVEFLVEPDVPSIHTRLRLSSGAEIALHCVHPRPPAPQESDSSVERDAELLVVGKAIKKDPSPVIVMGDLNDVAWSHTSDLFRDISGLLDPRVGRGFFNTFDARRWYVRYPLDHFFHSNDFRLVEFRRLERFGSDHFPVYIHLSHEPQAQREQPEPQANAAESAESREKIAEASSSQRSVRPSAPG